MATQLDKNFVITGDKFEGYRIVKYLGTVMGMDHEAYCNRKKMQEIFDKHQAVMIEKAEELGANAITSVKILYPDQGVNSDTFIFYGTAVVIEPING